MNPRRIEVTAWVLGGVGLLLSLLGWWLSPRIFPAAWLTAMTLWLAWPLGCLALLLTHALTGGRWGDAARPVFCLGITTLPLLLPALVPLLLSLHALYAWARPDMHLGNGFYLNVPFFAGRGVVYLIVWFGLALAVLRALRRGRALGGIAAMGLILLALTFTFASIDTTMSVNPHFTSTIYGMLSAAEAGLFALSVTVLIAAASVDRPVLADLGKLLLGLVVLWAYLEFMQLLIIWQSDLESDASFYVHRSSGLWGGVTAAIALLHFALPFAVLIFPAAQRSRTAMIFVAGLLIVMQVLRSWWLVLPSIPRGPGWVDIACMVAFGGLAAGVACRAAARLQVRHV
jgi:hypothetical protein